MDKSGHTDRSEELHALATSRAQSEDWDGAIAALREAIVHREKGEFPLGHHSDILLPQLLHAAGRHKQAWKEFNRLLFKVARSPQYQPITSPMLLAELFDEAVSLVAHTLDVEYCKILRLLPDGKALRLEAGVGWKPGLVGHALIDAGEDSQAGYSLLHREPVIVEDLRMERRFRGTGLLHEHGVAWVIIDEPKFRSSVGALPRAAVAATTPRLRIVPEVPTTRSKPMAPIWSQCRSISSRMCF